MSLRAIPLSLTLLLLVTTLARAADEETAPPLGFAKDTMTLSTSLAASAALDNKHLTFVGSEVGLDYFVRDNLSLGIDLRVSNVNRRGPNTWLGEFGGALRHHFYQWDRYTLFADISFAVSQAGEEVPAGGTYFNFVTRTGLGATAKLNDNMHLMFGTRFFHISNARIDGNDSNPSVNGLEGFVSLVWRIQ